MDDGEDGEDLTAGLSSLLVRLCRYCATFSLGFCKLTTPSSSLDWPIVTEMPLVLDTHEAQSRQDAELGERGGVAPPGETCPVGWRMLPW